MRANEIELKHNENVLANSLQLIILILIPPPKKKKKQKQKTSCQIPFACYIVSVNIAHCLSGFSISIF